MLCVDAAAHADAIRAADARPPSVSLVSLPDEHAALRRVAARLEDLAALPREHGLMQQLLVYAPGAHGYAAHTDCRSGEAPSLRTVPPAEQGEQPRAQAAWGEGVVMARR